MENQQIRQIQLKSINSRVKIHCNQWKAAREGEEPCAKQWEQTGSKQLTGTLNSSHRQG